MSCRSSGESRHGWRARLVGLVVTPRLPKAGVPGPAHHPRYAMRNAKMKRALLGLPSKAQKSAMTYFPSEKYHRQRRLNCCVRDGNRCFPSLILTDNPTNSPFGEEARSHCPVRCPRHLPGQSDRTRATRRNKWRSDSAGGCQRNENCCYS